MTKSAQPITAQFRGAFRESSRDIMRMDKGAGGKADG
jgi:hypothetical protein